MTNSDFSLNYSLFLRTAELLSAERVLKTSPGRRPGPGARPRGRAGPRREDSVRAAAPTHVTAVSCQKAERGSLFGWFCILNVHIPETMRGARYFYCTARRDFNIWG